VVWEAVFLLVVLKIPIVYLCVVVWWAIKAEPGPDEGAALVARVSPTDQGPCDWRERHRKRVLAGRRPPRRPVGPRVSTAFARRSDAE
jgi:hypothetical protein